MSKNRRACEDLTGRKYERLTIVKFVGYAGEKGNERMWEASCDCGNTITLSTHRFKRGRTRSCGCLHKELSSARALKMKHRLPPGEAGFNHVLRVYKHNAIKRNLEFNLTEAEFRIITKQNCHYCNSLPNQTVPIDKKNGDYLHNGVDRIDSNIGYNLTNCVPCCSLCNLSKMETGIDEFKDWVTRVYNHFIRKDNEDIN